jgi:hypothetical protein
MTVEPVPLFLAPMAGITDLAYRLLAREAGADFTITEFTAASGLSRHAKHSWLKVESDPRESPFIPQIFGGDIDATERLSSPRPTLYGKHTRFCNARSMSLSVRIEVAVIVITELWVPSSGMRCALVSPGPLCDP